MSPTPTANHRFTSAAVTMDPRQPNQALRQTPQWGQMQREMFRAPNEGEYQPFDTDPENIAAVAKQRLSENGWLYSNCNAGIGWTHHANRMAFYRHRIIPRMLVDTNTRDTAGELFGHKLAAVSSSICKTPTLTS